MIIDGHEYLPAPPALARAWILYLAAYRHWEEAALRAVRPRLTDRVSGAPPRSADGSIEVRVEWDDLRPLMPHLRRAEFALADLLDRIEPPALAGPEPRPGVFFVTPYRDPGATWHHAGTRLVMIPDRARWDYRLCRSLAAELRPQTTGAALLNLARAHEPPERWSWAC